MQQPFHRPISLGWGYGRRETPQWPVASMLCLLATCLGTHLHAQSDRATAPTALPASPAAPPTRPAVVEFDVAVAIRDAQQRLKDLESADWGADVKAKVREHTQATLAEYETFQRRLDIWKQFGQQIRGADEATHKARERREGLAQSTGKQSTAPLPDIDANATLRVIEQHLAQSEESLKERRKVAEQHNVEPQRRAARLAELPRQIEAAQAKLEKAAAALATPPASDPEAPVEVAQRRLLEAQTLVLQLNLDIYAKERAAYEATTELIQLQRDIAAAEQAEGERVAEFWRHRVNEQRSHEAKLEAEKAQKDAASADPALAGVADRIQRLSKERQAVATRIQQTSDTRVADEKNLARLAADFSRSKNLVQVAGLSQNTGTILRQQREQLPDIRHHRDGIRKRHHDFSEVRFQKYLYDIQRQDLAATIAAPDQTTSQRRYVEVQMQRLLEQQRDALDELLIDYAKYENELLELNHVEEQIIRQTGDYREFIDQTVPWIRSAETLNVRDLRLAVDAGQWLVDPKSWHRLVGELGQDIRHHLLTFVVFLAVFIPWASYQRRYRRRIAEQGAAVIHRGYSRFWPTMEVVGATILISTVWPALLWYLAWRLAGTMSDFPFVATVGEGLMGVAEVWLPLELLRQTSRRHGLAEAHFGWIPAHVQLLRWHLRWLIFMALPLVFVANVASIQQQEKLWAGSLGRMALILLLLLLAFFIQRVLRPHGGIMPSLTGGATGGWAYRLRHLWYGIGTATPLVLAGLAAAGYLETSQVLILRLFRTAWLIVGLVICGELLNRWVLISRRRLALDQARQRRETADRSNAISGSSAEPLPVEATVDLAEVSQQTRKLIHVALVVLGFAGAYVIWKDLVPALRFLNRFSVGLSGNGVSLTDLLFAIACLAITIAAARNIPGLLELTVLQPLPLDTGVRYAITTVVRYLIVFTGVLIAASAIGLTWNSIQWLVAAMGIGLGFGLQEIFANFISGIVVLLERPIRVGDVVTLGDTTGMVMKIRMRATTIRDWDRREYVVPNKDLITGRLLNWTLSDQVNRLVIPIGLEYGSDTQTARELMLDIARKHPVIMRDPEPTATFEGFGENSLNLVLRCFLPSLENRLPTMHELHTEIDRAFRAANIRIAFPQREVHVRGFLPPGPPPSEPEHRP